MAYFYSRVKNDKQNLLFWIFPLREAYMQASIMSHRTRTNLNILRVFTVFTVKDTAVTEAEETWSDNKIKRYQDLNAHCKGMVAVIQQEAIAAGIFVWLQIENEEMKSGIHSLSLYPRRLLRGDQKGESTRYHEIVVSYGDKHPHNDVWTTAYKRTATKTRRG